MGLFSDIYNTVARFFRPQEETGEEASKSVATNRLKLVLMQDRTNLTPKILEQMRSELIDLLSRYVELDKELLELNFEQEGEQVALMLSIPVIRAKDEDEIEAAIQAHKESLMDAADNEDSDEVDEDDEESENDSDEDNEIEDDSEGEEISEETEEIEASEGTEVKPKKRKKKENVSTPEEMSSKTQEEETSEQTEEANL